MLSIGFLGSYWVGRSPFRLAPIRPPVLYMFINDVLHILDSDLIIHSCPPTSTWQRGREYKGALSLLRAFRFSHQDVGPLHTAPVAALVLEFDAAELSVRQLFLKCSSQLRRIATIPTTGASADSDDVLASQRKTLQHIVLR